MSVTPPLRTGDDIPIVNATPFTIATRVWQFRPGQDALIVIAKGSFDLAQEAQAVAREQSDFPTGQVRVDDDPDKSCVTANDFALLKPRAEVLVVGHAHARAGPVRASRVAFHFGRGPQRVDKSIVVHGDRRWQTGLAGPRPSEPEPFQSIPLIYERAFGGPSHPHNPWGVGHGGSPALPNLELPGRPVSHPNDMLPPACFAPIALELAERWAKLGSYDRRWFVERWPYFAADFDYAFFQDAPLDQQLDAIAGDEPFRAEGVHPELAELRGTLPGERARVFAYLRPSGDLLKVPLRLDTVVFNFDELVVHLTWRGSIDVAARDAPEIQLLLLAREGTREELSEAQARQLLADTLALRDRQDVEPQEAAEAEPAAGPEDAAAITGAEPDQDELAIHEKLAALGVEPPGPAGLPPGPPADPDAVIAALRQAGAPDEQLAELLAAMTADPPAPPDSAVSSGALTGPESAVSSGAPDSGQGPEQDEPARLRRMVLAMRANGESLAGVDLSRADLSDLDLRGCDLTRTTLAGARLSRCLLDGAVLIEAQLTGAALDGASLTGAELREADLTAAELDRARFDGADLSLCDLSGASGTGVSFAGVRGERTVMADARLEGASFEKASLSAADFTRAQLARANFAHAELPKVRLYDAVLRAATFDGARLPNARVEGADLYRASLQRVRAEGAVFENAKLDRAVLTGAILSESSFVRAVARKADFSRADLRQGRLGRADFGGSCFARANLMMADLEAADLRIADLRGANLHACNLWQTRLSDAQLGGAILTQSTWAMRPT